MTAENKRVEMEASPSHGLKDFLTNDALQGFGRNSVSDVLLSSKCS